MYRLYQQATGDKNIFPITNTREKIRREISYCVAAVCLFFSKIKFFILSKKKEQNKSIIFCDKT